MRWRASFGWVGGSVKEGWGRELLVVDMGVYRLLVVV